MCLCVCVVCVVCVCVCLCAIHETSHVPPVLPDKEGPCLLRVCFLYVVVVVCVWYVCVCVVCGVCVCVCLYVHTEGAFLANGISLKMECTYILVCSVLDLYKR